MRTPLRFALALSALAAPALAFQNPLPLHNGTDVVFLPSPGPSVGPPAGSGIVDPLAAYDYRVYPRQSLRSPSGTLGLAGVRFSLIDLDPTTPPVLYDVWIGRGMPSPSVPGQIVPDFSDPAALVIPGGTVPLPTSPCSSPGFLPTTDVSLAFACGTSGLTVPADGATDVVVVLLVPGGMSSTGGTCGFGTSTVAPTWSTDEGQADPLGTGTNPYAGYHLAGAAPPLPVPDEETPVIELLFCEPTISARIGGDVGLVGLHASVGAGPSFGYTVHDRGGAGDLCLAAASLAPLLPAPGTALFGASLLLDPSDPALLATLRSGTIAAGGTFESANPQVVPASAAGLAVTSQALIVHLATLTARSTQTLRTAFVP